MNWKNRYRKYEHMYEPTCTAGRGTIRMSFTPTSTSTLFDDFVGWRPE